MVIKRSSVWPPPVYVATFSDGTECRMSCGDYRKGTKATGYDFERGRKVCCQAIGTERVFKAWGGSWHPDRIPSPSPAADIVVGHFEHDGEIILDPYFSTAPEVPKAKTSPLDRLIANVNKLGHGDLARLRAEIDARLAA